MSNLTIAIIGANGFIGGRLAEWLVLQNLATVRPIVRSYKGLARLARFNLDFRISDATDSSMLEKQIKGCDVIFHCVVGDRNTILKSAEAIYKASSKANVKRMVYISTAVVHGLNPVPGTNDESDFWYRKPFSGYDYGVNKAKAENILRRLRQNGKVEIVTLRPFIVFGPRSQLWMAKIATDMLSGEAYLIDKGEGICNTIYVDNLVYALWLAATVKEAANQDFLITDGEKITWKNLYTCVAEAVGVDIETIPSLDSSQLKGYMANINRMKKSLFKKQLVHAAKLIFPPDWIPVIRRVLPASVIQKLERAGISYEMQTTLNKSQDNSINLMPINMEITTLQQCKYMLPIDKAKRVLGYTAQVDFQLAAERTAEWLRFVMGLN